MRKEIIKYSEIKENPEVQENDSLSDNLEISFLIFNDNNYEEKIVEKIDDCFKSLKRNYKYWINIYGIHNNDFVEIVKTLSEKIKLHPLTQEDLLNIGQRPKLDDFKSYLYSVFHHLRYDDQEECIIEEQISLILGSNFVISFHESNEEIFKPIKERIKLKKGIVRSQKSDYLFYLLIDHIVDNYFDIIEVLEDEVEELEEKLVSKPKEKTLSEIHHLKKEFIRLRKSILPLRNVISTLEKAENTLIHKSITSLYFRDIYTHIFQLIDSIELFREMLSGMLNIYLTSLSNKTNEVMKVLTIIATIFMPLTFIVGIYGMNFKYMPEIGWKWGYPLILGIILIIAIIMVIFFKKKKWW